MKTAFEHINLVYFSPTGTSRKIAQSICDGLKISSYSEIDLTYRATSLSDVSSDTVTLFVSPVYAGRLPRVFLERLASLRGNNSPCIIAVVYGNRDYEDALLELKDEVIQRGFLPVSAATFIGEHSYSTETMPIASGRPDMCDLSMAELFGKESLDKLNTVDSNDVLIVPGNFPYKELKVQPPVAPVSTDDCTVCGLCATLCPTEAITVGDNISTDVYKCIKCCACVKGCPSGARVFDTPFAKYLFDNFKERKLPEFYF